MPLDQYTRNLTQIITHPHILAHNPTKIIVITPPPCDELRTGELDVPQRGHNTHLSARQAAYSQAARDVAAAAAAAEGKQVVCVDFQRALMEYAAARTPGWKERDDGVLLGSAESGVRGHFEKLLPDGLHLSGEAYEVLWRLVEQEIEIPEGESVEGYVFPKWREAEWLK